jgi:hypothetical protein
MTAPINAGAVKFEVVVLLVRAVKANACVLNREYVNHSFTI